MRIPATQGRKPDLGSPESGEKALFVTVYVINTSLRDIPGVLVAEVIPQQPFRACSPSLLVWVRSFASALCSSFPLGMVAVAATAAAAGAVCGWLLPCA